VIEDFAIGSIALVLNARLATLNVKHLARIRGLTVED
jgi:predicted nucleic acid-binding protein